jgi:hypothetical protein
MMVATAIAMNDRAITASDSATVGPIQAGPAVVCHSASISSIREASPTRDGLVR